jgi:hypothetical protein
MAGMDPQEAFAAFRASCWQKAMAIKDFGTGRTSFEINSTEFLELGKMRRVLTGQFANMEETWDNLLQCVQEYSIDVDSDTVFKELADVLRSTKRVVDAALVLSGHFKQASPVQAGVVGISDADKGKNVDENVAGDIGGNETGGGDGTEVRKEDIGGNREEGLRDVEGVADSKEAGLRDDGGNADGEEVCDCQETETVKQWTGLMREGLGKALRERWSKDPEKHPEPISDELLDGKRSVFDTSRRSCHIGVGKIVEFMVRNDNETLTKAKLEELKRLQEALRRQWGYRLHENHGKQ